MATSTQQRIKKQREARFKEGWAEVRVWVPTKEDAEKVQQFAESLRKHVMELEGFNELKGVKKMPFNNREKIKEAIAMQGSAAFSTPSGAVQTLLSDFARDGYLEDFSKAFTIFARAYPSNAVYVEESVPAKIMNHYWIRNQDIEVNKFSAWEKKNPNWGDVLKDTLRDADAFERQVKHMCQQMKA
ncbi:hypothetical protein DXT88_03785 [Herbaspirillum lusitanum]|uniref:hypothetical protein n=1 Tax=Herbaspirillum lusitanum TaxID=213312 RepID=UPI0022385778|nr:hypothetical protein [Herbaspirillum lusitanum]MCW5297288.1 hypothetical protein [Herbaspirillum lusitanum]